MLFSHIFLILEVANRSVNNDSEKNSSTLSDWTPFFELGTTDDILFPPSQKTSDAQYGASNNSPWALSAVPSDVAFTAMEASGNVSVAASANTIFPVDVSRSGHGFCLPKCGRFPSMIQPQQQRQQQLLVASTTTAVSLFNKLLENQSLEDASLKETAIPKQQPQSVAVPIRESTHFKPIRSESMEDAYYLKPGFDEFSAVIENMEDYYIFQHNDTGIAAALATSTDAAAGQATSAMTKEKLNGDHQKRSFSLKFRATNPDKVCQTEDREFDFEAYRRLSECEENKGDANALLDNQWYSQEFEIWAYQPTEQRNNLTTSR